MSQVHNDQSKMISINENIDKTSAEITENVVYWEMEDLTSIQISVADQQGSLFKILDIFRNHNVNMTRIQSKPNKMIDDAKIVNFIADFNGRITDPNISSMIKDLEAVSKQVTLLTTPEVPWFPTQILDFNYIGKRILGAGDGIQDCDHPGFHDAEYRKRRAEIAQAALNYKL